MILRKIFILLILASFGLTLSGCAFVESVTNNVSSFIGLSETGTVIANTAQIRSSYAVVAADLLEVKRGATLDILDDVNFEKVHWFRVRARDEDNTEGWIESQNIILSDALEKSRKLADEEKEVLPQASGQLRAATNLRLTPEQTDDNILLKLDSGSNFDIVDWKFVPKTVDSSDVDDASKGEQKKPAKIKTKNEEIEAAKEKNEPEKTEDKYDIWYKVRLEPTVSPAPSGWVFGKQVELQVPSDIVFYQHNNKKFVTWQRLDNIETGDKTSSKDAVKAAKPGSWVIFSRSNLVKAQDGVEPDFDGFLVLGYDKYNEEHYTAYRSNDVWGLLPLKMEGTGDNKSFTIQLRNVSGQMEEKRFVVTKDVKGRIKVTVPPDMDKMAK